MICFRYADEAKMTGDKRAEERVNTSVKSPLEALDRYEEFVAELRANPRFVQAEPRMSHEEFMQTLKDDPHFRVLPPRGEGFIIPQPDGAKGGDSEA
jgi:hypothetical protein